MALTRIEIAKEYRNQQCNVIKDFYIPILNETVMYKRAVGFFNSSALYEMAIGLEQLVRNNGKIQLIVSPQLTEEDIKSIQLGYKLRDEVVAESILRCIDEPKTTSEKKKLNLLANLIAENVLDIKIAFKLNANSAGIFHEKIGLVIDAEGNKVAFTGSMNETYSGLLLNYESIDVYCSWRPEDYERVEIKEKAFDNLWQNVDSAMDVIEFPKVAIERLNKYKTDSTQQLFATIDDGFEHEQNEKVSEAQSFFRLPSNVKLHTYQEDAIKSWLEHNGRGIFDMATGTGKTYTALGALSSLTSVLHGHLAVVIVCPYQHLVEQWVEDIELFGVKPIVAYSDSSQKNWRKYLEDGVTEYNYKIRKNLCAITTNATFITEFFQDKILKLKKNVCIVVDEAHNFGAKNISKKMPINCDYRLALSATIERHRDSEGTQKITDYFGETCISFSLEEAIKQGFLTSYYYYPILVYLNDDELEDYKELSHKIARLGGGSQENCEKNSYLKTLLLKRARIIAGAHNKIEALLNAIEPFKNENHILVYCGATKYREDGDATDTEEINEVKQIEKINKLLYDRYGMKVRKFTSSETKVERHNIIETFKDGKDLQVVTAIKCLDEGMNIPSINRAFILASSTNPKEYIQRRGRVLRKSEGKESSEIYDFITLPRVLQQVEFCSKEEIKVELPLVRREMERMMDFAKSARNPSSIDEIHMKILEAYQVYSTMEGNYND